jgi:SH3 domain protein
MVALLNQITKRADAQSSSRSNGQIAMVIGLMLVTVSAASLVPQQAYAAERAWVRSEIRLNVRSGPGTKYRILGGVATGDGLSVLSRGDGWTRVRLEDGIDGWIPEGYLKSDPPPTVRLAQLETEVASLRVRLGATTEEGEKLRTSNESLSSTDGAQRAEIDRLILDNTKLRAGARYPELIAGASILAAGMILGAMLHRSSSNRRPSSRIRL